MQKFDSLPQFIETGTLYIIQLDSVIIIDDNTPGDDTNTSFIFTYNTAKNAPLTEKNIIFAFELFDFQIKAVDLKLKMKLYL